MNIDRAIPDKIARDELVIVPRSMRGEPKQGKQTTGLQDKCAVIAATHDLRGQMPSGFSQDVANVVADFAAAKLDVVQARQVLNTAKARTSDLESRTGSENPTDAARVELRTPPWWLWWNILSADAPTVAVVWAVLFAHASGNRLSVAEATVLVLSVWVIYVCDRVLDGWTTKSRAVLQERHLFCERHRFALTSLTLIASAAIVCLTINRLQAVETSAGMKLGAILVLYMAGTHVRRGRVHFVLPKEIASGLLFASGVTLPFWSRCMRFPWEACLPWMLFALLCCLNCLAIECWENHSRDEGWRQTPHQFVRWADSRISQIAATLALAALTACLVRGAERSYRPALLAVCIGSLFMLVLNRKRTKLSPAASRVLADVTLVIPALVAFAIGG